MNNDEKIEYRFRKEIKTILKEIPKSKIKECQEIMDNFLEKNTTVDYDEIFNITGIKARERTIVATALYLLDYEGKFGFCVNFTYFLFKITNKEQNSSFSSTKRKTYDEKCKILAEKGFKTLDKSEVNSPLDRLRKLRNKIAHFDFIIDEDGEFQTFDKGIKKIVGILPEHGELLDYINAMIPALRDFVEFW